MWLVDLFESAYFKGFAREPTSSLLREAGLEAVRVRKALFFSVRVVDLQAPPAEVPGSGSLDGDSP